MSEIPSSGLVRSLSLVDIVMVGIAAMIGGAIFVLVGPAMNEAGPALMIVFLVNGVITLFTAMTYAELGSALPELVEVMVGLDKDYQDQMHLSVDGWRGLHTL